ncbi:MAG: S8 family serine peptidase, partial [Oscillospiraceae bacterium]|nr:S8 family serine peptidase [Oscillospiraceae bacterium]
MKHLNKRLLSLVMAFCMLLSLAAPVAAAPASKVSFTQIDNSAVTADLLTKADDDLNTMSDYVDTDVVRVSIFLEDQSTIMAGFATDSIAANSQAMAYRANLKDKQAETTAAIEKTIGGKLDVVWNLTLAANVISANVKFGQIEAIKAVKGVRDVLVETCYQPDVVKADEVNDPNMATSSAQIGSAAAWAAGYTGAGSRIAVIDTGSDIDHQSLNAEAFEYALAQLAEKAGVSYEEYVASLDLLDADEIAAVADQLNAPVNENTYISSKLPFGYNYVDKGKYDVSHDNDTQGSHGSHVAGIATANSYIPTEDGFVSALSSSMVQGVAPEAQLITMKVFGKAGGAYDSDYMAAIEDAIVLGCDSANLSLGSGNPGTSRNATAEYQAILESLTEAGIVVAMSAGNSGYWAESAYNAGYLYADDISMQTNGSPGSFTNSLSVASVDNDGKTGYFFSVGDLMVVYNEMLEGNSGAYSNLPFTTIAGEHEYVFIDGLGTAEDWAAVGSALEGKIALCSRGEISFFEKAQYAVEAGAIATFIYNNQAGVINMDLTDYPYTQPCASLTQADGAAVKAASTPVTDEAGNVLYYTGTMTISDSMGVGQFGSAYYTMSSFSSWGVPGSLELKPEITAPGGNIYSLNGVDKSGKAYETMSGTSMASPQVAGMAALVAQYIRENGLENATGLSARQLAQSLLMSTAVPMLAKANTYYPVIQQGAGLANVGAAVSADSYITMADGSNAGAADGKVKVELGDDPTREGAYTATFTLNNLTDTEKVFDLAADFFIQAPTSDGVNMYMYTATALIGADVTWTVDGEEFVAGTYTGLDFNADGIVNSDDGQAILDYATGVSENLSNIKKADMDADGDVDSYDAYLFLKDLNSAYAVLPAGGSAEVTVNFSLSNSWKNTINYYYPNGTYLQGYIFAETVPTEEGVAGTSHSIPVLGFFGNWTEASMFDVGTYQEYATGDETRTPYLGKADANSILVTYANEPGTKYYFGGNPLVPDDTYMPERNAVNSADTISGVKFTSIRNASASKFEVVNETTGEILAQGFPGAVSSAYYYVNGATWKNTSYTLNATATLAAASEGDVVSLGLTLAPEYYVDAEGNVNWDALAEGATLGTTAVIDNTAPELVDVTLSLLNNNLTVLASDNEYVAAVALYNKAGTEVLAYTGAYQDIDKGETAEYSFSLNGVKGSKFLLQVMDYAMNTTTFMVELQLGGDVEQLPDMIAFDLDQNFWTSFTTASTNKDIAKYAASEATIIAATIVDHMVLAADDAGNVYVMPEKDLTDVTLIANCGTVLLDMAYNPADDTIYAVNEYGNLVTVDRLTAEVEVIGEIGVLTNTLACDANGTFYCNGYGSGAVYSFTLDTLDAPTQLIANVGITSQYIQAMEIDPNNGKLMWTSYYMRSLMGYTFGYSYLYEIDVNAGTYTRYKDLYDELAALIIPSKTEGESWTAPTDVITGIKMSAETASVLKGSTVALNAAVLPWTVIDRTVTWTSSDEAVATVDENGVVTGIAAGTAVITATSNLDASFSATCEVTVSALEITINGTLQDADGNPMLYSWNMAETDTWVGGTALETSMTSATYNTASDKYYIMDGVADSWSMHVVDPDSGASESVGANAIGLPLWDMVYSDYYSTEEAPKVNGIYYYYLLPVKDPMALDTSAFGLSSYLANYSGASYLTAVASAGFEQITTQGVTYDSERILMLDNAGT